MSKNIGGIDRIIRIVAGIVLILWAIAGAPAAAWSWIGWLGIVPIATALIGWCPAYVPFGIKTCKVA